jgi:hypothetical protein
MATRSGKKETRKRAVLQFRVHQPDYDELAKAAKAKKLTISEEAARRLRTYRLWMKERGPQAFLIEVEEPRFCRFAASELEELVTRAVSRGVEQVLKTMAIKQIGEG